MQDSSQKKTVTRQLFKSTVLLGGASMVNTLIGMFRTKIIAILLGPDGVGLFGIFTNLSTMIGNFSAMGISESGVRQIAKEADSANPDRKYEICVIIRKLVFWCGILGLCLMVLLGKFLSVFTLGSEEYATSIRWLGVAVLFNLLAGGQLCIIKGMRAVKLLAKINIIGAISSTIICLPFYYFWGKRGIAGSIIFCSLAMLLTSAYFSRKVIATKPKVILKNEISEIKTITRQGIGFMGSALIWSMEAYFTRVVELSFLSLTDLGIIAAATSLTNVLLGFILNSIWADYYPSLCAAVNHRKKTELLIDQQTTLILLITLPGMIGMIVFTPILIQIFYTAKFNMAVGLMKILCLASLSRVAMYPLAFILPAQGRTITYCFLELAYAGLQVFLIYFFTRFFSLTGVGLAYVSQMVMQLVVNLFIYYLLMRCRWSGKVILLFFAANIVLLGIWLGTLSTYAMIRWLNMAVAVIFILLSVFFLAKELGAQKFSDILNIRNLLRHKTE